MNFIDKLIKYIKQFLAIEPVKEEKMIRETNKNIGKKLKKKKTRKQGNIQ